MRALTFVLLVAVLAGSCSPRTGIPDDGSQFFTYSFEAGDMEGWAVDATDTFVGADEIDWSVTPSTTRATTGSTSLYFIVDNLTDAAKVWVERPFDVAPNTAHTVTVEFDLASQDWGDFNLWTVIAGVTNEDPETTSQLEDSFDGDTKAWDEDTGFRWLPISRTVTLTSGSDGKLWVVAGVWGTWETERDYYLDNLRVRIEPVTPL
jgi:hypothetical protein